MEIFIDSSIIIKENFLRSTNAQALLKAAKFLGFEIIIPETVIDEVRGNFFSKLVEKLTTFDKTQREISSLTGLALVEIVPADEADKYNGWLDVIIERYEIQILPYPKIPLKELVTESYKSRKPFKESGEGHKDYLIWKAICSCINLQNADDERYFLTENVKDFCEKNEDNWVLHSYLADQVEEGKTNPLVYYNLKVFFDERIGPHLRGINFADIPELALEDLQERASEVLEHDLSHYSADGFEGLSFQNDVTISGVHGVDFQDWSLTEVDQDEILITIIGSVEIEVDGFIDKHDYYTIDAEDPNLFVVDGNWNDWVMAVSSTIETPFELTLSYSKEEQSITGHTINLVNETFIYDY
ncbi:PIN domain-containing protein [bacterium]|nr:PIN domain-containing protein [bacterium]